MPVGQKILLQLSRNGKNWIDVFDPNPRVLHSFEAYAAPRIDQIEPAFGPVKPKEETTIQIKGVNFNCPDATCSKLKVRFQNKMGDNFFSTNVQKTDSKTIVATVPKYTVPDVLSVEVTMNGVDYTNNGLTYGFYDPYLIDVSPRLISTDGSTIVTVKGIGFVKSDEVKVQFQNYSSPIRCGNSDCVMPATFVSSNVVTAPTFAKDKLTYSNSKKQVEWDPFELSVAVYSNAFVHNNIQLFYFKQPSFQLLSTSETPANIPISLMVNIDADE
jgi:hypothetical protein